jgi:hypothetical protein
MKKSEIKLLMFLINQELACGIAFLPGVLKFEDSIIRYN